MSSSAYPNAAEWGYVDHCPARKGSGFQSQSRQAQSDGCEPGWVGPMCDTTSYISGAKVAVAPAVDLLKIGPWQPLQPLAIVDVGSGASITILDMRVNGQSIHTKFDEDSAAGLATVQPSLGLVSNLTYEAIRSGANAFPPSPLVDQNNKLWLDVGGVALQAIELFLYWGNPAIGRKTALNNMQKNGGANYAG